MTTIIKTGSLVCCWVLIISLIVPLGKSHYVLHVFIIIWNGYRLTCDTWYAATADKVEDQCGLPGCTNRRKTEGGTVHDYCCLDHAQKDAPNRDGEH